VTSPAAVQQAERITKPHMSCLPDGPDPQRSCRCFADIGSCVPNERARWPSRRLSCRCSSASSAAGQFSAFGGGAQVDLLEVCAVGSSLGARVATPAGRGNPQHRATRACSSASPRQQRRRRLWRPLGRLWQGRGAVFLCSPGQWSLAGCRTAAPAVVFRSRAAAPELNACAAAQAAGHAVAGRATGVIRLPAFASLRQWVLPDRQVGQDPIVRPGRPAPSQGGEPAGSSRGSAAGCVDVRPVRIGSD